MKKLIEEQSELGLHCLWRPICLKTQDHNGTVSIKQQPISYLINIVMFRFNYLFDIDLTNGHKLKNASKS